MTKNFEDRASSVKVSSARRRPKNGKVIRIGANGGAATLNADLLFLVLCLIHAAPDGQSRKLTGRRRLVARVGRGNVQRRSCPRHVEMVDGLETM